MSPKNISNEKIITLKVSKEEASEKIKSRIELGKEMLKSPMNNEEEIEDLKNKKATWSDYNVELLKRLFSDDSISKEYQSTSGAIRAVPFDPYSTGRAWGVKLENLKNSLNAKINKLESIFERLELFSEKSKNQSDNFKKVGQFSAPNVWIEIKKDFDISKRAFGKKIHFVKDKFKRKIIFRDIEHAYFFAQNGFNKAAVILAGGVIEELLRLYLKYKKISPSDNTFNKYIISCDDKGLFKKGISKLSDSLRDFRNIVHLKNEVNKRYTISKSTAKGAISSIFTISNDF